MTIQWLGHSCFRVRAAGYAIVLDPYADGSVTGLPPMRTTANAVLCSHDHHDHNAVQVVALADSDAPSPFVVTKVESTHDDVGGTKRGMNTIHVLEAEGVRVAHLGDLGTQLTEAQRARIGRLDALLVPVGGYYTIDAEGAKAVVDALKPTVTIPMHYRTEAYGYPEIAGFDGYLRLVDDAVLYETDTMDITGQTPRQTAVLTVQPA